MRLERLPFRLYTAHGDSMGSEGSGMWEQHLEILSFMYGTFKPSLEFKRTLNSKLGSALRLCIVASAVACLPTQ
jgi:hypothetical protein